MKQLNIYDAKRKLSSLIEDAVNGESFIIAKAGKPLVKVMRIEAPTQKQQRRLGFMNTPFQVPDDFDHMKDEDIQSEFEGEE